MALSCRHFVPDSIHLCTGILRNPSITLHYSSDMEDILNRLRSTCAFAADKLICNVESISSEFFQNKLINLRNSSFYIMTIPWFISLIADLILIGPLVRYIVNSHQLSKCNYYQFCWTLINVACCTNVRITGMHNTVIYIYSRSTSTFKNRLKTFLFSKWSGKLAELSWRALLRIVLL